MGNFSGRMWVLKKWMVKMNPTASNASSLWMMVATFRSQPGRNLVKNSENQRKIPVEPITTIGRTKDNLIRVDEPAVSRRHAQISLTSDGYVLRDLGSENGTYVNGERSETRVLAEGDRIQIGTVRFVFYDAGS